MGYEIIWDVNRHLLMKDKKQFEKNSDRSLIFVESDRSSIFVEELISPNKIELR